MEFTTDDIRAIGGRRYWKESRKKILISIVIIVAGLVIMFSSSAVGGWPTVSTYVIDADSSVPIITEDGEYVYKIKESGGYTYLNGVLMERISGSTSSGGKTAMNIIGVILTLVGFGYLIYTGFKEGGYKNRFVDEWIKSK